MAEPAIGAHQRVNAGLAKAVCGRFDRGGRAPGRFGAAPGRLLATELEPGEKRVPLGVDAGGVALPLRVERVQLGAVLRGGGIGPGDAVIIRGQVDPIGHDGHRLLYTKGFIGGWQT